MRIDQIKSYLALVEHKNFTLAAESLFISQSLVSKHIISLEKELDIILFDRKGRTVTITPAGKQLYSNMVRIVNEYNDALSKIGYIQSATHTKICISAPYDLTQYGIADLIVAFEQTHPQLYIETQECSHGTMQSNIDNNVSYCAIGYRELWKDAGSYHVIPLCEDPLVVVCSHRHPLAQSDILSMEELCNEYFCFPKEDKLLFDFIHGVCASENFFPRLTLSDVRLMTIREYVRQGIRLTITTHSRAKRVFSSDEFFFIPLYKVPPLTLSIIFKHNQLSKTYEDFLTFSIQYAKDNFTHQPI